MKYRSLFFQSRNGLAHRTCKIFMTSRCPKLCLHRCVEHAFEHVLAKEREHPKAEIRLGESGSDGCRSVQAETVRHRQWAWRREPCGTFLRTEMSWLIMGEGLSGTFSQPKFFPQKEEEEKKEVKLHPKVFSFVQHVLKFGCGMHLNQGRVTFR